MCRVDVNDFAPDVVVVALVAESGSRCCLEIQEPVNVWSPVGPNNEIVATA